MDGVVRVDLGMGGAQVAEEPVAVVTGVVGKLRDHPNVWMTSPEHQARQKGNAKLEKANNVAQANVSYVVDKRLRILACHGLTT